jgi:hypothetical protein
VASEVASGLAACGLLALIVFGIGHATWAILVAAPLVLAFAAYGAYRLYRAVRHHQDFGGLIEVAAILTALAIPPLAFYMTTCGCL